MLVRILQLKYDTKYAFMDYSYAAKNGFNINDYKEVYNFIYHIQPNSDNGYQVLISHKEKYRLLDDLYDKYSITINLPYNFSGRLMNVSDIVSLGDEYYYCNEKGWTLL